MSQNRKVVLYIAMSLDGYIAKTNDDISFLDKIQKAGEDYGYGEFISTIDTVIIGRKTYDKVLSMGYGFPHNDKDTYIITRTPREQIGTVKFYTGNLTELVTRLKNQEGKNIFCDGGAEIAHELMKENLVEEFYISIIPVFLGEGIRLFKDGRPEQNLKLVSTQLFDTGLVQLHYQVE
ncbi:MAG: dihydrofolate reductase family protein [Microscillaceae bacterium]|nr:dihydrofolate reductase family protein [Microscillaceae bacterium]